LHQLFIVFNQGVIVTILFGTRTFAIYQYNRIVLGMTIISFIVTAAIIVWLISHGHRTAVPFAGGCSNITPIDTARRLALAWGLCILYDSQFLILTTIQWIRLRKLIQNDRSLGMRAVWTMARDSALYFCAMLAANALTIFTFLSGNTLTYGIGATLSTNISVALMARLMINVRQCNGEWVGFSTAASGPSGTPADTGIHFRRSVELGTGADVAGDIETSASTRIAVVGGD